MEASLAEHIESLANRGIRLNRTQLWILETCFNEPSSISELAEKRKISYHSTYKAVRKLEEMKLISYAYQIGKETFYRCHFDISQTADITFKIKWRKQQLSFEEFLGHISSKDSWLRRNDAVVFLSLLHLYNRTLSKNEERQPLSPGGPEIKSLLLSVAKEYEEYAGVLRTITEMPLFEANTDHIEAMGEIPTEFVHVNGIQINRGWNKEVSVKGLLEKTDLKKIGQEEMKEYHHED